MGFPAYNFVAVPYFGAIFSVPVNLCTTQSQVNSQGQTIGGHQSRVVNLSFNWVSTYPTQAVAVNLQSQTSTPLLDVVVMVYVDNTQNSANVTIIVPDTQQNINVPANTSGYYPVLTTGSIFNVYNGNSGQSVSNGSTAVIFCNFAIPGFLAPEPSLFIPSQTLVCQELQVTSGFFQNVTGIGNFVLDSLDMQIDFVAATAAGNCSGNIILFTASQLICQMYYGFVATATAGYPTVMTPISRTWPNGLALGPQSQLAVQSNAFVNTTHAFLRLNISGYTIPS